MSAATGLIAPFDGTTAGPRAAVQIDAGELEDFQRTARLLLGHPLVTPTWPNPRALTTVRRWEVPLRNEFSRVLGFRLDVGRSSARLYRRAATTSVHRGPFTRTLRPLGHVACSFLCLVLAALEELGDQTTASRLADAVLRLRSGDDALPVDLTVYTQRRAFVDAVTWLEDRGVLGLRDGGADQWLDHDAEGDALYDVDRDCVSRLLVSPPSVLRGGWGGRRLSGGNPLRPARRIGPRRCATARARRLVEGPVMSYIDLGPEELAYVRERRTRLVRDLEQLTGCHVESRAEGMSLVDAQIEPITESKHRFPGGGTLTQAALLWGAALVDLAATGEEVAAEMVRDPEVRPAVAAERWVGDAAGEQAWEDIVEEYRSRFSSDYRESPDKLRREVRELLGRFGLLGVEDDRLRVHAALARYRPDTEAEIGVAARQNTLTSQLFGDDHS
ncbi:MAG: TIGR02678 family protein [Candidatus Microthrix sp.]|nr:TIGR02678 family protein [Candidatus Microthrix sp.]MBK7321916.1 TIGR02678 family protein [Candidatus Microthrix sp.]